MEYTIASLAQEARISYDILRRATDAEMRWRIMRTERVVRYWMARGNEIVNLSEQLPWPVFEGEPVQAPPEKPA